MATVSGDEEMNEGALVLFALAGGFCSLLLLLSDYLEMRAREEADKLQIKWAERMIKEERWKK